MRKDSLMSELEAWLAALIKYVGLPEPQTEFKFHSERQWRFDFAWPAFRVAAECEGGTYTGGRHVTGVGFEKDAEKYNAAAIDGWAVLRFTRKMIQNGDAADAIKAAIEARS
jgi:very-short-patch-repair endonuclease